MHPTDNGLNEFETAVLQHMVQDNPWLLPVVGVLRVTSRTLTGNGSYTDFEHVAPSKGIPDGHIGLDRLISMPGIENGMGAVLFLKDGRATVLEAFVYGG